MKITVKKNLSSVKLIDKNYHLTDNLNVCYQDTKHMANYITGFQWWKTYTQEKYIKEKWETETITLWYI